MRIVFRHTLRRHILKGFALGCVIAAISAAQSVIDPANAVVQAALQRAYYVPVILAALWYRIPGGALAALLSIVVCVPHLDGPWLPVGPAIRQGVDMVVYLLLGVGLGAAASQNRRRVRRVRHRLAALATTNRRMRVAGERSLRAGSKYALEGIAAGLEQEIREPLSNLRAALAHVAGTPDGAALASSVTQGDRHPTDPLHTPGCLPAAPDGCPIVRAAGGPADRPRPDVFAVARRQLARLEAVLNAFIAYARPREPEPRWTDVADLLGRVRTRLAPLAERRTVSLDIEPQPGAPPLFVDPDLVERMIANVASNAVQASPRGDHVVIRSASHAGTRIIEVEDHGPGIAPEYLDRIFQPFFTTKERGTGLGLAIARQIVDAHEGRIEVRRQARAGGTVVRIALPERAEPTATALPMAGVHAHT